MAADTKARLSVSMNDAVGGKSTLLLHAFIDSAQTVAQAVTALGTLATNLATISNGGIKEASLSIVDTAVAAAPGAGANVSLVGNLGFLTAGSPSRFGQSVPSYLESLIGADGTIDMTAGATAAWSTYILAAVLGGHFTNNAYVNYSAHSNGFRSGRKLRR
jgi:hypothetical protein